MELNTEEMQSSVCNQERTPLIFDYRLSGKSWESVDADKYRGITITHDLSWNTLSSNIIVNKGNRILALKRRNRQVNSPTLKSNA